MGRGGEKTKPIQSQTKPICSFIVLRSAFGVVVLSFLCKQESRFLDGSGFRIKNDIPDGMFHGVRFEKTKPIC